MDAAPIVAREDLLPLLREGWVGPENAWQALERCAPLLERVVARVYHRHGRRCRVLEDQGDLLTYTVCALLEKAEAKGGLALPSGWDRPELAPWLASVVYRQAIDVLRRLGRQEREHLTREGEVEALGVQRADDGASPQGAAERLDVQRAHRAINALLDRGDLPPVQALAWVLLSRPRLLTRAWVERASGLAHQGRVGTQRGLVRRPDETWALLFAWLPRHAHDPRSRDSRRELAWILRSADDSTPEAWRAASPDEACRAQDLLRQWENRFRPFILALLEEDKP